MYNQDLKAKVIQQALMPGAPSIAELARRVGLPHGTVWGWIQRAKLRDVSTSTKPPSCPDDRKPEEKLRIVMAANGLSEQELGEFLRREGIHESDLAEWRRALQGAAMAALGGASAPERSEAKRIRELEAELRRKDKALAEAGALLLLQKKVRTIWGDADDDTKPKKDG